MMEDWERAIKKGKKP